MDAEDVAQIAESLRQALSGQAERAAELLTEFGWHELLDDEPRIAVSILFPLAGELRLSGSQLDSVMLRGGGFGSENEELRVVLPAPGNHVPTSRISVQGTVSIDGVVQPGTSALLVPVTDHDGHVSFVQSDAVEALPGEPLDESAGWTRISATSSDVSRVSVDGADEVWTAMVAAGRRALAYELIGTGAQMLSTTVEHVSSRVQFGQPLGVFQSVKHQLADVYLWHEVATLTADAAWEDLGAPSAALAKATALRFTRTARTVCQQLLGGMGFTWEHDFHRWLRRALTVEPLLGTAQGLHTELGQALRAGAISDSLIAL